MGQSDCLAAEGISSSDVVCARANDVRQRNEAGGPRKLVDARFDGLQKSFAQVAGR